MLYSTAPKAQKHVYGVPKKTVAKRLFAGAKRLLRAEGACCWRRRRLVQGKNTVAKRLLQARSAYYAPKAPVVGVEGAWCRGSVGAEGTEGAEGA